MVPNLGLGAIEGDANFHRLSNLHVKYKPLYKLFWKRYFLHSLINIDFERITSVLLVSVCVLKCWGAQLFRNRYKQGNHHYAMYQSASQKWLTNVQTGQQNQISHTVWLSTIDFATMLRDDKTLTQIRSLSIEHWWVHKIKCHTTYLLTLIQPLNMENGIQYLRLHCHFSMTINMCIYCPVLIYHSVLHVCPVKCCIRT